jgi:hypothetical protein
MVVKITSCTSRGESNAKIGYFMRYSDEPVYGFYCSSPKTVNEAMKCIVPEKKPRSNSRTSISIIFSVPKRNGKNIADEEYVQHFFNFIDKWFPNTKAAIAVIHHNSKHSHIHGAINPENIDGSRVRYTKKELREIPIWMKEYELEHNLDKPIIPKEKQYTIKYKAVKEKMPKNILSLREFKSKCFNVGRASPDFPDTYDDLLQEWKLVKRHGRGAKNIEKYTDQIDNLMNKVKDLEWNKIDMLNQNSIRQEVDRKQKKEKEKDYVRKYDVLDFKSKKDENFRQF